MKKTTDKYARLLSNTVLFTVSTFSSKVLSFVLTRLYTGVLEMGDFGQVDLVVQTANLLIPLVSLGISNAVVRFGLEKSVSKDGVFTSGLAAIGLGFGVMLLCSPLLAQVKSVGDWIGWLYVYVLISCLRTLCCQFVRAKLYTRLYAIDGILSTIYTVGFNVLFLLVLDMGPAGFLLAIICADALSVVFLSLVAVLPQYIHFRKFDKALFKSMLRYSLPLVPALMFWWVTAASDRFFITYMVSDAANGLYAAASKVPSIVTIFSTIFTEAWQLSAVTDGQDAGRESFFSNIFQTVSSVAFLVGGGLILFCRFVMKFLVAEAYFSAWEFIPFLVCATVFSSLVAFLNSVYMVEKKTNRSLVTMVFGAVANLILNAIFIRDYGPQGAAFATFLSYLLVFLIRAVDTQRLIRIRFAPIKLFVNTALLLAMAFVMVAQATMWQLWCSLLLAAMAALNATSLIRGLMQLLNKRKGPAKNT